MFGLYIYTHLFDQHFAFCNGPLWQCLRDRQGPPFCILWPLLFGKWSSGRLVIKMSMSQFFGVHAEIGHHRWIWPFASCADWLIDWKFYLISLAHSVKYDFQWPSHSYTIYTHSYYYIYNIYTYYRILLFAINMIIYCICTVVLRSYCICNSEIKHNTLPSRNESITKQGYSSAANKETSVLVSQDANLVSQNADAGQS